MTELDDKTKALQDALLALPEVQAFFSLRDQIAADPFLMAMQEQAKDHQKKMMKTLTDSSLYQYHKQAYEDHLKQFNEHPLVQNYDEIKAELKPLLDQLQAILE
jgi:cell fate (sporulation/competence/biofilm development) regulator YlbF (YheA/YmcA/DUF963 family)